MNIETVRTFLATVETGNLNRAAEQLHVTQSTVTARINSLEDEVGQKLLVRSKSGTELTGAGFKFMRYAEMLVDTWQQARQEISLPKGFSGVCQIGCQRDLWPTAGKVLANIMHEQMPTIALSYWSGNMAEIARWLTSGMIDMAISTELPGGRPIEHEVLCCEKIIQVASVERDLVRWDPHYIFVDYGPAFRRWHAETYPVDDTPPVTFSECDWALDHILLHGGSGYLPEKLVLPLLHDRRLFPVRGAPAFHRDTFLLRTQNCLANLPQLRNIIDAARTTLAE